MKLERGRWARLGKDLYDFSKKEFRFYLYGRVGNP